MWRELVWETEKEKIIYVYYSAPSTIIGPPGKDE